MDLPPDVPDLAAPRRKAVIVMLAAAMGAPVMATHGVAVFALAIIERLDISRGQIGLLPSAMFLTAALASILAGRLTDRLGGRASFCALWVVVAFGAIVIATATTLPVMLLGFVIVGFGAAVTNPSTNELVAQHIPGHRRGLAMGVKQAGVPVAAVVAGALLPALGNAFGWRVAIMAIAALSLAGLALTVVVVPAAEDRTARRTSGGRPRGPADPQIPVLAVYGLVMGSGMGVFTAYLPVYAQDRLGASLGQAGAVVSVTGLVGVASRLFWGHHTDRSADLFRPLAAIAACSAGAMTLVLLSASAGLPLLWVGAAVYGATAVSWNSLAMTAIVRSAGRPASGRSTGIVMTGFYGGYVVGPALAGAALATTGSYAVAWAGALVMFAVGAAVAASPAHLARSADLAPVVTVDGHM